MSREKRIERGVPSMPTGRSTVTAIVTAYNYGRFLAECAHSVLTQRDVDVRLIIVDDCSTDDTPLVTAELGRDPRVTVIRNEPNLGQIPSVNMALERVESEYVMKLDADDLLTPDSLARSTALLEAHPRIGFVYGRPLHFSGPVPAMASTPAKSWTVWAGHDWVAGRCRSGYNVISQPEVVMRTAALRAAGPVRADLPHTFDMHLWIQLASMGNVGRINGPAQGLYRVHDASLQRTIHAGALFDLRGRRDAFDAAFAAAAGTIPGARELHETARRNLAAVALDRACRAYDRGQTCEQPVDELVSFALETCPGARQLREWRALERRRYVGAKRAQRHPRFFAAALARRSAEELGHWLWLRTGEQ
jgi:hypothetical protein